VHFDFSFSKIVQQKEGGGEGNSWTVPGKISKIRGGESEILVGTLTRDSVQGPNLGNRGGEKKRKGSKGIKILLHPGNVAPARF